MAKVQQNERELETERMPKNSTETCQEYREISIFVIESTEKFIFFYFLSFMLVHGY